MKRASLFAASVLLVAAGLFLFGQYVPPPTPGIPYTSAQNAGTDSICAVGKDATLFLDGSLKTVTVTPGADVLLPNAGTWTTTGGAGTGASGTFVASGGNLVSVAIVATGSGYTSNPTWVPSSGTKGTSTIAFSGCANTANATSETAFATTVTIPANVLSDGTIPLNFGMGEIGTATVPTTVFKIRLGPGGTSATLALQTTATASAASSATYGTMVIACHATASAVASSATPVLTGCATPNFSPYFRNLLPVSGAFTTAVNTTVAVPVTLTITFGAATAGNAFFVYSISPN